VGVFGGVFDPPHIGHLVVAQEVWRRLGLDEVLIVPVGRSADRAAAGRSGDLRARMVEAAVSGHPGLRCSRWEVDRSGPSYTVDTLRHLQAAEPDAQIWFVLGADRLAGFPEWHDPAGILDIARLAVVPRGGVDAAQAQVLGDRVAPGRVDVVECPPIGVSSTLVRRRLAAGEPVRYLVPDGVARLLPEASADGVA
jgi:nicotinate-nucleotide adenylyltransferase